MVSNRETPRLLVSSFFREKRKTSAYNPHQHFVQNRAKAPPINLVAIGQAFDNLWREVLRCPTKRVRRLCTSRLELWRYSKFLAASNPVRPYSC
jgi:hypothetical protein